jgi:hypothetical protein
MAWMREFARALAQGGWVLRSGGADGADSAFEAGSHEVDPALAEIYLPWRGFNNNTSRRYRVSDEALAIARTVHPAWERLSSAARKLHSRNVYQVLGESLDAPSELLVCWTADGCEAERTRNSRTGGTGTAIVLAERHGVPRFNLARKESRTRLREWLQAQGITAELSGPPEDSEPVTAPLF